MRLVITGILALIILIMICAFDKRNSENLQTNSLSTTHKKAVERPHFTPMYYFDWKSSFIFSKTNEKAFYLSIHYK